MSVVRVRDNESFENALRRFKKQCERSGVSEVKKREHYEKPSVKKKKKAIAAKRRPSKSLKSFQDIRRSNNMSLQEQLVNDMKRGDEGP